MCDMGNSEAWLNSDGGRAGEQGEAGEGRDLVRRGEEGIRSREVGNGGVGEMNEGGDSEADERRMGSRVEGGDDPTDGAGSMGDKEMGEETEVRWSRGAVEGTIGAGTGCFMVEVGLSVAAVGSVWRQRGHTPGWVTGMKSATTSP